jgi:hypothetical protein
VLVTSVVDSGFWSGQTVFDTSVIDSGFWSG